MTASLLLVGSWLSATLTIITLKKVTPLYVDKYRGRGIPKKVLMVCMKEDMRKKEVK